LDGNTAIANILKQEGTEYVFCYPANSLIEAAAIAGIRPILARTERTLVNMADGYTRVLNGQKNGIVITQRGPGSENAFPGIAQAYSDGVPVLFMPGGFEIDRLGVPPLFWAVDNYRAVTKWQAVITSTGRISEVMRRAFTHLRYGRPSPVLVEVPREVGSDEVQEEALNYWPVKRVRTAGDPEAVREAVRLLLSARNPVIHAGQGVLWSQAWEELRQFAELLQVPVLTTNPGKSAFPEDHPLSLGAGCGTAPKAVFHFLKKADLVFGVGCSFTKSQYNIRVPDGKTMVQVTVDERDVNKDYPIAQAVIGDVKLVLEQLMEEARRQMKASGWQPNDKVASEIRKVKEEWLSEWMPRLTSNETPINPYRVIWDLMHTVDRTKTIVTHEAGHPRDQMLPFFETIIPRGYLGWGKSTHLGYSMGLAMGAKLGAPDKLVVNIMGDAAIGMSGMDIETSVRERIPILTIIFNNGGMGGYSRALPTALAKYGISRLGGNYAKLAEALGAYAERVEHPDEIVPAIKRAQKKVEAGQTVLLEMITKEEPVFSRY